MSSGMTIALLILFLVGTILGGIMDATYITASDVGFYETLMKAQSMDFSPISAVTVGWGFLQALWEALWWDYSFLQDEWIIVRMVGIAISLGLIIPFLMNIIGNIASAIGGLFTR